LVAHLQNRTSPRNSQVLQKSHQANARTTAMMEGHNKTRKRRAAHNSSLAKWRVTCFYYSLVLN